MLLELENLCLETSSRASACRTRRTLFVNASARLLTHPVFLDDRHLAEMRRAHPSIVIEVSEKEIVWNYPAFPRGAREAAGGRVRFAIDDAAFGLLGSSRSSSCARVHQGGRLHRPEPPRRLDQTRGLSGSCPSAGRSVPS